MRRARPQSPNFATLGGAVAGTRRVTGMDRHNPNSNGVS